MTFPCFSQENSWKGQAVIANKPKDQVKFQVSQEGKLVKTEFQGDYPIMVREDKGNGLLVWNGYHAGWVEKTDFLLMKDAMKYFSQRVAADSNDQFALYTRGLLYLHGEQNCDKAIVDMDTLIKKNPTDADAFNVRGVAWERKGDNLKAMQNYNEAISLNSKVALYYCNRGFLLLHSKLYEEAIRNFNQAIELNPRMSEAYLNRAEIWLLHERWDEALADYVQVFRLDSRNFDALVAMGVLFHKKGQLEKALRSYTLAHQERPENYKVLLERAIVLHQLGMYSHAVTDCCKVLEKDPRHSKALFQRALSYHKDKQVEKALADLNTLVKLDPKNLEAYLQRGNVFRDQGNLDFAMADYEAALKLNPKDCRAYLLKAHIRIIHKDWEKAKSDLLEALKLNPVDPLCLNELAWFLATCPEDKFRDGKRALEISKRLCEQSKWEDFIYLETLAASYAEAGDFEAAQKYQAISLQLFKNSDGEKRLQQYRQKKPCRDVEGASR